MTRITESQWEQQYVPQPNPFDTTNGWFNDNDESTFFETFGEQIAYVRDMDERYVWTLLSLDHENWSDGMIVNGYRDTRTGHFVCKNPWDGDAGTITVTEDA